MADDSATFSITDNNGNVIASGIVELSPGGVVDSISGTIDGQTITGLSDAGGADNTLKQIGYFGFKNGNTYDIYNYYGVDNAGMSFTAGNSVFNIEYPGTVPTNAGEETGTILTNLTTGTQTTTTFSAEYDEYVTICFVTGTRIRTARGDVKVEDLAIGDMALTSMGERRPVRWIGHRTIESPTYRQHPVCIRAGAFGSGVPEHDLLLSQGHPVLVDAEVDGEGGHLVPIMCLINGTTIERVAVDCVTYWHVELDSHDILLAEGLPVESYLDWGDRAFFSEASDHALANPDFVVPGLAGRCRPVAIDGALVENERRRLDGIFVGRLVAACAWPSDRTSSPV